MEVKSRIRKEKVREPDRHFENEQDSHGKESTVEAL